MRRAAKRDANERPIIDALIQVGCKVIQETNIDIYVYYRGVWYPMEIKDKGGKLTDYQKDLHNELSDIYGFDVPIVETLEDAFRVLGINQAEGELS